MLRAGSARKRIRAICARDKAVRLEGPKLLLSSFI
jgi:hypothetical protein